jgi:DNA-binding MarR family transcriptional regulator
MRITKRGFGGVLRQLVGEGYVVQKAGEADRRERLLYPTARGKALGARLAAPQLERLARALAAESGGNADADSVRRFLYAMISQEDRPAVTELLASAGGETRDRG